MALDQDGELGNDGRVGNFLRQSLTETSRHYELLYEPKIENSGSWGP